MDKINFAAGPAILPKEVTEQLAKDIVSYQDTGLSILELSHRGPEFTIIMAEARQLIRKLLKLPDHYSPLFLSGGATTQFAMIPMNFLPKGGAAGYVDTGTWSTKAIAAAKMYGEVDVCASSHDKQFTYIPKDYKVDPDWFYLHLTSNNTISGTQMHEVPDAGDVPIMLDMSSDIFSKPMTDIERYGVIFASAQKNLGPAGTTLVIVNQKLLGEVDRPIPDAFNYQKHIDKQSALNTPPVLPILGCLYMLRWLKEYGINRLAKDNKDKAEMLYGELDNNPMFIPRVKNAEDRSIMNVCFDIAKPNLENTFLVFCENHGIVGIKGHRSVGGFRASMYNALPKEGVKKLIDVMRDFSWRFG